MDMNLKTFEEWSKQSDYDFETAEAMFKSGRYIYAVFMCHLAIEKSLKGFYAKKFSRNPDKTHDLNYLADSSKLELPENLQRILDDLNDLSIPTRYPEELEKVLKAFSATKTESIIRDTSELRAWLKKLP